MKILETTWATTGTMHHAYFLVGGGVETVGELVGFLEETVGMRTVGNPDFWRGKFATLNIEDVRGITEAQQVKGFDKKENQRKIFIIETDFITEGAQNALLKVFEEPTAGTHFFIISPQDILLPTLRSRMQIIDMHDGSKKFDEKNVLSMKFNERLAVVKKIVEDIGDENKTKQDAIALLNHVEKELYDHGVEKYAGQLAVCEHARASLYDNGAPIKMILENVMLSI
jgi:DNA polymerase III delta prime subunit